MKNAQLLADIANYIRGVGECDSTAGVSYYEDDVPACLICNAVIGGIISFEEARNKAIDFPHGFADFFDVSITEAEDVIFHNHIAPLNNTTGENYYQACKELLEKYGYGHLLGEVSEYSFDELIQKINADELEAVA